MDHFDQRLSLGSVPQPRQMENTLPPRAAQFPCEQHNSGKETPLLNFISMRSHKCGLSIVKTSNLVHLYSAKNNCSSTQECTNYNTHIHKVQHAYKITTHTITTHIQYNAIPYSGNLLQEEIFANLAVLLSEEIFAIFNYS